MRKKSSISHEEVVELLFRFIKVYDIHHDVTTANTGEKV